MARLGSQSCCQLRRGSMLETHCCQREINRRAASAVITTDFQCPHCSRLCASELGLRTHLRVYKWVAERKRHHRIWWTTTISFGHCLSFFPFLSLFVCFLSVFHLSLLLSLFVFLILDIFLFLTLSFTLSFFFYLSHSLYLSLSVFLILSLFLSLSWLFPPSIFLLLSSSFSLSYFFHLFHLLSLFIFLIFSFPFPFLCYSVFLFSSFCPDAGFRIRWLYPLGRNKVKSKVSRPWSRVTRGLPFH